MIIALGVAWRQQQKCLVGWLVWRGGKRIGGTGECLFNGKRNHNYVVANPPFHDQCFAAAPTDNNNNTSPTMDAEQVNLVLLTDSYKVKKNLHILLQQKV